MTDEAKKSLWTGIAIGAASGGVIFGVTGYCVSKNRQKKIYEPRLKAARRAGYSDGYTTGRTEGFAAGVDDARKNNHSDEAIQAAYDRGVEDTLAETEKWMAANTIQVESNDPAVIQKAIEEHQKAAEAKNDAKISDSKPLNEKNYAEKSNEAPKSALSEPYEPKKSAQTFSGRKYQIQLPDGSSLIYPYEIFCDENGMLDPVNSRENLREFEKDPHKIRAVWAACGWGDYNPEYEDGIPDAETINNWDVSIKDLSKMYADADKTLGDEPEERTIERERYHDELERYSTHPENAPRLISKTEFEEESHLDKINIDYYAVDNVFLQPMDDDRKLEDPFYDLGVTNGQELFEKSRFDDENDPDIVHVKNFHQNFVAEITRYNKSSTGLQDGSAYLNGETGFGGGNSGL